MLVAVDPPDWSQLSFDQLQLLGYLERDIALTSTRTMELRSGKRMQRQTYVNDGKFSVRVGEERRSALSIIDVQPCSVGYDHIRLLP